MRQNPHNHFRLLDAGDHLELPAATGVATLAAYAQGPFFRTTALPENAAQDESARQRGRLAEPDPVPSFQLAHVGAQVTCEKRA